jgi:hypothetical protein
MNKRGQFTIFVIIGIVVLIITGLVLYFTTDIFTGTAESIAYAPEVQEVADWNEECLQELAKEAVVDVSLHGGYNIVVSDEYAYNDNGFLVPYLYYDRSNLMLSPFAIEQVIASEMVSRMNVQCYESNPYGEDFSLTLEDTISVVPTINLEDVQFTVSFPMTATVGDNSYNLNKDYVFTVPVRMGLVYLAANNIVDFSVSDPNYFNYDAMLQQDVSVELLKMSDEVYMFILTDDESFEEGEDYTFMFAGYYPVSEEETDTTLLALLAEEEGL